MSRNSSDFVYTETVMEKTIQQLRILRQLENAIKYAPDEDARSAAVIQQQEYQTTTFQEVDSFEDSVENANARQTLRRLKTEAAAEAQVSLRAEKAALTKAKKGLVASMLNLRHVRKAAMCLMSVNKHFRQDVKIWNTKAVDPIWVNHTGGVRFSSFGTGWILTMWCRFCRN